MPNNHIIIAIIGLYAIAVLGITIRFLRNEQKTNEKDTYEQQQEYMRQEQEQWSRWQAHQHKEYAQQQTNEHRQEKAQKTQENINPEDVAYTHKLFIDAYEKYEETKKATQRAQIAYINAKQQEEQANNAFEHAFHVHEQAKKGKYTRPKDPDFNNDIHPSLIYFNVTVAEHTIVKRAYHSMCKQHHPDIVRAEERTNATKKIQEINMHYKTLCEHYSW